VIKAQRPITQSLQDAAAGGCSIPIFICAIHSLAAIEVLPYDLVMSGGHDGKVRDTEAAANKVSAGGPLEQKTELY
jgi:hypothetical protein